MHTKCPQCRSTFRLTVAALRQAHGRVRCGSCGHVFDSLDHLLDDSSETNSPALEETSAGERFARQSKALLDTLDELTGPEDVRIEDTGVEWRVLNADDNEAEDEDEDDPAATFAAESGGTAADTAGSTGTIRWTIDEPTDDIDTEATRTDIRPEDRPQPPDVPSEAELAALSAQNALDLGADDDLGEMRYDDNTPLPDDDGYAAGPPRRRAEDWRPPPVTSELQEDLALGDPDDWRELLDEVDDAGSNLPAIDRVADRDTRVDEPDEPVDTLSQVGDASPDEVLEDSTDDAEDAPCELLLDADPQDEPSVEERAATAEDASAQRTADDSAQVETIVMEGDTIRHLADGADADPTPAAAQSFTIDIPPPEAHDEPPAERPRWQAVAAVGVLGLLLAAQLLHANRNTLATVGGVHNLLGPLYSALGSPLAPAWNIRGWRFEATSGSTDAAGAVLTVRSRIANRADTPLPYPLLHISLTDRYEDIVGSRVLTPADYLPGPADVQQPVAAGGKFTALIAIDAPADDATGFKLNVCYRLTGDRLRCAIDDFRR